MNEDIWDFLLELGSTDIHDTKDRFLNNASFYAKHLDRCLKDPSFSELKKYLQENDIQNAFETAHSLKGMTGNLGLTPIYNLLIKITEPLRAGQIDGMLELYSLLEKELEKTRKVAEGYLK